MATERSRSAKLLNPFCRSRRHTRGSFPSFRARVDWHQVMLGPPSLNLFPLQLTRCISPNRDSFSQTRAPQHVPTSEPFPETPLLLSCRSFERLTRRRELLLVRSLPTRISSCSHPSLFLFSWRGDGRGFLGALAAGDGGDNLAAVEAAVLDEDFAGVEAADEDSGDVNSGDVGFESFEVDFGLARFGVETNADGFEELEIGMIAGHGEGVKRGEFFRAAAILNDDFAGLEAHDFGVEAGGDFSGADAIFDVGADPVFEGAAEFGSAMNESDARAAAK